MIVNPSAPSLALAVLLAASAAPPARAQTSLDPRALDQLAPAAKATPAPPVRRAPVRTPYHASVDGPHQTLPPLGHVPTSPPPSKVVMPAAPPPVPVLPPPLIVPTRPVPPPAPPPVAADAPGSASALAHGVRVTFGSGDFDLNTQTLAALRDLAHAAPSSDTAFSVTAYAAGSPDDPSTARRLSLSRALAARSVLLAEGIASARIYVKALGASAPSIAEGSPDRVDVTMAQGVASPVATPAPPAAAATSQKAAP